MLDFKALQEKPLVKFLLYLFKFGLSIFILVKIAERIDFGNAVTGITGLSPLVFLLLLSLSALRHFLQYHNWLYALSINPGFTANKRDVFSSYMIGLPLRFAAPGGHASAAKVLYVHNSSRIASLWSTVLERSIMTWASLSFAAAAGLYYYTETAPWLWIGLFIICLYLPKFLLLGLGSKQSWRFLKDNFNRYAPRMMIIQVANTMLTYLQYWILLNNLAKLSFWDTWIRMALTQVSNTIPITLAGLGLREGFAIHFLKSAGITAEQAVTATLSLFIIQDVIPALVGGWFLLVGKKR